MRTIDFSILPPTGSLETPSHGTIADLLRQIPYFLRGGMIPPLAVVNDVLVTGLADAGMSGGCRWSSIILDDAEFREIVHELESTGDFAGNTLTFEEPPPWVMTQSDWGVWVSYRRYAIPVEENLRLTRSIVETQRLMNEAAAHGDEAMRDECLVKLMELSSMRSEFVMKHRNPMQ